MPRGADLQGPARPRRVSAAAAPIRRRRRGPRSAPPPRGRRPRRSGSSSAPQPTERLTLDAPVLTSLVGGEREKRRPVALAAIPAAHEAGGARDRRSPVLRASRRRSDRHRRRGALEPARQAARTRPAASTITQQLVRNVFLPKMFAGHDAAGRRASNRCAAKRSRSWVSFIITHARVEGRHPRDVPERRDARPARVVRHRRRRRRRRGCSSARTSAT